jgi:hypothetical protein
MSILTSIQHTFSRQALKRKKKTAGGNKSAMNFSNAKSIAVLIDLGKDTESQDATIVLKYINSLRGYGKTISLLAYIDLPKVPDVLGFDAFCKKDLNWAQVPKGAVCENFLAQEYDILLCLYQESPQGLEFIAEATAAVIKAGFYKSDEAFQPDLMVHNKNGNFSKLLLQLDEAINKINK